MVHALERCHNLLAPQGRLIDIHPNGDPPPITVRLGAKHHLVGWVRETSDYDTYVLADDALQTAVSRNLYQQQAQETFAFTTYFDALPDLQHYLSAEWSNAYLEELVAMQIETIMHTPLPDQEIILKEIVKITLLQP